MSRDSSSCRPASAHNGRTLKRAVDLVLFKTYAELKSEAQRTYIGVVWWVFEPIIFMAIFYFVFGILFQRGTQGYIAFLLVGLVPWHWVQATIMQSSSVIISNYPLLNQVFVPKFVFPTVVLLSNSAKFLMVYGILLVYLSLSGDGPSFIWLESLAVLASLLTLIAGCAYIAAAITPLLPDVRILIDNLLRALFYFSGIFYAIDSLPDPIRRWMRFNPFAMALQDLRTILIEHSTPPVWDVLILSCVGCGLIAIGLGILHRNETRYAKLPV